MHTNGPSILQGISTIKDFGEYCTASMNKDRQDTYELSNLGVVKLPINTSGSLVRLEKLVFTQSAMVVGPAVGYGVVSVEKGPMTISLYWQEGVIPSELPAEMITYLDGALRI